MKQGLKVLMLVSVFLLAGNPVFAGTLSAGVQGWYTFWDSGLAKMNTQALESQLKREMDQAKDDLPDFIDYDSLKVGDPESKGPCFGPVIAYETGDKKWQFSSAIMWFGFYTTSVDSSVMVEGDFPVVGTVKRPVGINTELEIDYKEIDLRVQRLFMNTFGIFAGYKYEAFSSEEKADYSVSFNGDSMSASLDFSLDSNMHMVYAGAAYIRPFFQKFIFNGNLGFGIPFAGGVEQDIRIRSTFFDDDIKNSGGEIKSAYMIFGEIIIGYKLSENVNLEAGYQYRRLNVEVEKIDSNADGDAIDSAEEVDVFHGIIVSATYLIDL